MILVFGSINADLIVPVPRLPQPGETVLGGDYVLLPGGKRCCTRPWLRAVPAPPSCLPAPSVRIPLPISPSHCCAARVSICDWCELSISPPAAPRSWSRKTERTR